MNNFYKFMYGRYGIDDLYKFNLVLYLIFLIIQLFVRNKVISILELIIIIIMFYRFLSKDIVKRKKENDLYLKIKNDILKPFINIKRNIMDKDSVYKRCHKCHKVLKLPLPDHKGIKKVICPKCKYKNKFIVLKREKIEIIK